MVQVEGKKWMSRPYRSRIIISSLVTWKEIRKFLVNRAYLALEFLCYLDIVWLSAMNNAFLWLNCFPKLFFMKIFSFHYKFGNILFHISSEDILSNLVKLAAWLLIILNLADYYVQWSFDNIVIVLAGRDDFHASPLVAILFFESLDKFPSVV